MDRQKLHHLVQQYIIPHINGNISDDLIWNEISENPDLMENEYLEFDDDEILDYDTNMDLFMEWIVEEEEDTLAEMYEALHVYWVKYGPHNPDELFASGYDNEKHDPSYFPDFMDWLDTLHDEPRETWLMRDLRNEPYFNKVLEDFIDAHDVHSGKYHDLVRFPADPQDVYGWFIVPEWLYERLRSKKEVVAQVHGMYLWGRGGFGYALTDESAFKDIVQDMRLRGEDESDED